MKNQACKSTVAAFTLVELLVVISIIGMLAALVTLGGISVINKSKIKSTQTQMQQIITAIESYKAHKGFYPPDNPKDLRTNVLYYELVGMKGVSPDFTTLDGVDSITLDSTMTNKLSVSGFANFSSGVDSDDALTAENYFKGVGAKQAKYVGDVKLLVAGVPGPGDENPNPWFYNSSNPTNNPESYDLWAVIMVGKATNIICNWSRTPIAR